jgi:flagellar basal-body rod protein FlgG
MRALDIAATGMVAQQTNIEVISNNIANMTTTGYKRQRADFEDLLYQSQQRVGSRSSDAGTIVPTGVQLGLGVKTSAIYRINEQGTMARTDNPLDVAINGKGYFTIQLPNGENAYTRAGALQLSPEGEIVTADGYTVMPGIVVPENAVDIAINASGEVQVKVADDPTPQLLGQIEITTFINNAGLESIGDNLFLETVASGDPITGTPGEDGVGTILQGFVENSNVEPVTEISALITAQRAYEFNSKIIGASDEMMQTVAAAKR